MATFGCIRLFKEQQEYELESDILRDSGCESVYVGKNVNDFIQGLSKNDILIVTTIVNLAQNRKDLFDIFILIIEKEINFVSLQEPEFEISSRPNLLYKVVAGIKNMEEKNYKRLWGRDRVPKKTIMRIYQKHQTTGKSIRKLCKEEHISKVSYYRHVNEIKAD